MTELMKEKDVVELTGISKPTLHKLMETGQADLGAVVRGEQRTSYYYFRTKVERFVKGGCDIEKYQELVSSIKMMNLLLTNAIATLPEGYEILKKIQEEGHE